MLGTRNDSPASVGKPLTATGVKKPAKPIPADLAAKLAEIRKRPMPGDREFLERELKGLTVAQLETIDPDLSLGSGSKASKIEELVRRHTGILAHESITHGTHDRAFDPLGANAKDRALQEEFKRRKAIAVERGDREEYAALLAGYGVAGAGPGLPPEKATSKWEAHLEGLAEGHKRDRELLAEQLAARGKPLTASGSKHIDEPPSSGESAITKPAAKGPGRISAKDLPEAMAEIDAMVADPQPWARDRMNNLLGRMTLAQIQGVLDRHSPGTKLAGVSAGVNTKPQKVSRAVEHLIGGKLDSDAIGRGILGDGGLGGASKADEIATLNRRIEELRVKSRDSRSESQRASLDDKRRRLEAERAALGGKPTSKVPAGGTQAAPSSREARDARAARLDGGGPKA
jgi:hypothetical protein